MGEESGDHFEFPKTPSRRRLTSTLTQADQAVGSQARMPSHNYFAVAAIALWRGTSYALTVRQSAVAGRTELGITKFNWTTATRPAGIPMNRTNAGAADSHRDGEHRSGQTTYRRSRGRREAGERYAGTLRLLRENRVPCAWAMAAEEDCSCAVH